MLVTLHLALFSLLASPSPGCSAGMDQKDRYDTVPMVQTAETVDSPQLQSFQVVDTSFMAQRQFLMVQTVRRTIDIEQLLYTVIDVPVVRSHSSRVQTWRRQLSSHSCSSSFCVDTVVHIPVVVQRQMPGGSVVTVAVTSRG